MQNQSPKPHPKNVPGDFYVEDQCCTACAMTEAAAPDLFGWEKSHCFVQRQPVTEKELDEMFTAIMWGEFDCVRYRGKDESFLRRLGESRFLEQADFPPSHEVTPIFRNCVTFDRNGERNLNASELCLEFTDYLKTLKHGAIKVRGPSAPLADGEAWIEYCWWETQFHRIYFSSRDVLTNTYLARTTSRFHAVTKELDDWLRRSGENSNIRWFTLRQLESGEMYGSRVPW